MDLKTTKFRKIISFFPLFFSSLAIFIASHQNGVPFDDSVILFQDKIMHFCAYFIYGLSIQFYLLSYKISTRKLIYLTIIVGSFYGISDEFHQYFIENRSTEFLDWVADTLGVSASIILRNKVLKIRNMIFKEKVNNINEV